MNQEFSEVYERLRALASAYFVGREAGHTLQPTALVNEAYLKLAASSVDAVDRSHFLAIAATAMRQVLVDHARRRRADKRGGDWQRVTVGDSRSLLDSNACPVDLLVLDDLLEKLSRVNELQAQIVELRFFGGQTTAEVATTLDTSVRTVERHWRFARAWLKQQMAPTDTARSTPGS